MNCNMKGKTLVISGGTKVSEKSVSINLQVMV